ncbi:MAG: hypothetical protein QOJ65_1485 [Fimbriimonadaceae bacterium]|jgi:hypothetical protein|nr:hypothetical protein [Fimbriimonadaceae bacterium]
MREISCDVLICGGGVGGCAAAMAACSLGMKVVMTEQNEWIGGQLTSQAVPPDEHPWIEEFGCTRRYREFRNRVRAFYRNELPLNARAKADPKLNPGNGWVSWLSHEPRIGWQVLNTMLQPYLTSGQLQIFTHAHPQSAETDGDRVLSVDLADYWMGEDKTIHAKYFIDAMELGELLPLTGTEYVVGAESQSQTGERHAVTGDAQPHNVQAITHVMALGWDPSEKHLVRKPSQYDRWRSHEPEVWRGPLFSWEILGAGTGEKRMLPLLNPGVFEGDLFTYRQVVDRANYKEGWPGHPVTLANWPQNDYFARSIIDVPEEEQALAYDEAEQLSLSLLYWMQTEAPRHDGGVGYPELYLRPDVLGTDSGLAQYPYVRESRRIQARFTVLEQHVSASENPGLDRAPAFGDSVGVGAYRIDLHLSTGGDGYIDLSSLPFQIPLGALIPVRMRNLLPACKNIGTTHVTNGCYRLHPVEWNIGEAAGALAALCVSRGFEPHQVHESAELTRELQSVLAAQGVEMEWPSTQLRPL